jgi:hypothetical protein
MQGSQHVATGQVKPSATKGMTNKTPMQTAAIATSELTDPIRNSFTITIDIKQTKTPPQDPSST